MIFLTVGTEYPFDRLVKKIDEAIETGTISDEVFAQIGKGEYQPQHMEWVKMLPQAEFAQRLQDSSTIISHAGMGTIIRCLELRKPLLVIPRRSEFGEHVNDHQVATARKFAGRDDLLVVFEMEDLLEGIQNLASFEPAGSAPGASHLIDFVRDYLRSIEPRD